MGKSLKDKYERICDLKDKFLEITETQLEGDISTVSAEELGYVVDMAKDMAEMMKYCEEAKYYCKVTEAMDKASDEEKSYYMTMYAPETNGYRHTHMGSIMEDSKMGSAWKSRKSYMDMVEHGAEKSDKTKELEHYMADLSKDITEIVDGLEAADKAILKQKLTTLAGKIA